MDFHLTYQELQRLQKLPIRIADNIISILAVDPYTIGVSPNRIEQYVAYIMRTEYMAHNLTDIVNMIKSTIFWFEYINRISSEYFTLDWLKINPDYIEFDIVNKAYKTAEIILQRDIYEKMDTIYPIIDIDIDTFKNEYYLEIELWSTQTLNILKEFLWLVFNEVV